VSGLVLCIFSHVDRNDYQSIDECKLAIDKYFYVRNEAFLENPKRAGKKLWGQEIVSPIFKERNNCKDPTSICALALIARQAGNAVKVLV